MGVSAPVAPAEPRTFAEHGPWALLRVPWVLLRFPVLALLIILEPVARLLLAGFALLLTLVAFFWKFAAPPQLHVPFFGMLALAVGCMALLAVYHAILRALSA